MTIIVSKNKVIIRLAKATIVSKALIAAYQKNIADMKVEIENHEATIIFLSKNGNGKRKQLAEKDCNKANGPPPKRERIEMDISGSSA